MKKRVVMCSEDGRACWIAAVKQDVAGGPLPWSFNNGGPSRPQRSLQPAASASFWNLPISHCYPSIPRCKANSTAIKSQVGFKLYRTVELDTLKKYTVAHGHKVGVAGSRLQGWAGNGGLCGELDRVRWRGMERDRWRGTEGEGQLEHIPIALPRSEQPA